MTIENETDIDGIGVAEQATITQMIQLAGWQGGEIDEKGLAFNLGTSLHLSRLGGLQVGHPLLLVKLSNDGHGGSDSNCERVQVMLVGCGGVGGQTRCEAGLIDSDGLVSKRFPL